MRGNLASTAFREAASACRRAKINVTVACRLRLAVRRCRSEFSTVDFQRKNNSRADIPAGDSSLATRLDPGARYTVIRESSLA
jgi:hypothetical protein